MHSYGIAYTDGTEKIVQLNRSVENNLMSQMEHRMEQKGKDEVWRLPEYKRKPSSFLRNSRVFRGADGRIRTGDLILTKGAKSKEYIECSWCLHEDITGFIIVF